jgi:hypothetical protein
MLIATPVIGRQPNAALVWFCATLPIPGCTAGIILVVGPVIKFVRHRLFVEACERAYRSPIAMLVIGSLLFIVSCAFVLSHSVGRRLAAHRDSDRLADVDDQFAPDILAAFDVLADARPASGRVSHLAGSGPNPAGPVLAVLRPPRLSGGSG